MDIEKGIEKFTKEEIKIIGINREIKVGGEVYLVQLADQDKKLYKIRKN